MKIKLLKSTTKNFYSELKNHLVIKGENISKVESTVDSILRDIKKNKDKSLKKYIKKFDGITYKRISSSLVSRKEILSAYKVVPKKLLSNIKKAIVNIKRFSKNQSIKSWKINEKGSVIGERVLPLNSVGVYVPGGKASYPSTVLMNAIPAKVAGVKTVIMTTPPYNGYVNPSVLVAADLCKVDKIYKFGGAHAIASLAYGTETISNVDKIVGPGNIFVASAKKKVFGTVGIDSFAGPSEILIIADDSANPDCIAIDMFAQAEHDELAQAILLTSSDKLIEKVSNSINNLIESQVRKNVIKKSLRNRGLFIKAKKLSELVNIANIIAPEHLEIICDNPDKLASNIFNAGAIFLGPNSPEVFGDYCAGPNHVLPTSGTSRYASPLGVYDFLKRTSVMKISQQHARELSDISASIAENEGLYAHADSAKYRK